MSTGSLPSSARPDAQPTRVCAVLRNPSAGRGRHADGVARALELLRGTGNDFATEVGIDADPVKAASALASALTEGRTTPIDLSSTTGPDGYQGWFAAVLGAGFDALVNERANAMRWPRGRRRYDFAIF